MTLIFWNKTGQKLNNLHLRVIVLQINDIVLSHKNIHCSTSEIKNNVMLHETNRYPSPIPWCWCPPNPDMNEWNNLEAIVFSTNKRYLTCSGKCCWTCSSYCCWFDFSNIFPQTGQSSTWSHCYCAIQEQRGLLWTWVHCWGSCVSCF